jgi:hypothetical protein
MYKAIIFPIVLRAVDLDVQKGNTEEDTPHLGIGQRKLQKAFRKLHIVLCFVVKSSEMS